MIEMPIGNTEALVTSASLSPGGLLRQKCSPGYSYFLIFKFSKHQAHDTLPPLLTSWSPPWQKVWAALQWQDGTRGCPRDSQEAI